MRTAVITTVHGRDEHLRRQRAGLARSRTPADLHVVVALGDPHVHEVVPDEAGDVLVVDCEVADERLPLARARNVGAAAALDNGADLLVFLDVDCIPGPGLIERYRWTAGESAHRDALLCGPVTYLPPPGPQGYPSAVEQLADPHPARPNPPPDATVVSSDYALFWSLSFALTGRTWHRVGGFCERYQGYGAEDTDFAQCAAAVGVGMRWVGGADAYHQYHSVSDPPTEHVDDILRNAAIFHRRWGWWPMMGWLDAFERQGLITWCDDGQPYRL